MKDADHERTTRWRRHRRIAVGAAGVAVVGGGAFLSATHMNADGPASSQPSASAAVAPDRTSAADALKPPAAIMGPALPSAPGPVESKGLGERLDEARRANKRLGTEVRRPVIKPAPNVDESKVKTQEEGTIAQDRRMMRIVSSRQDLSNFRELRWIADNGEPYGNARCSRNIQVSEQKAPEEKPTLLICWRNSKKKSVYTITVDLNRNPTPEQGVAALEKEWKRMG